MNITSDMLETLQETSRTFFLSIQRLPEGLQEAVGSAYLCLRAIDEIEDHEGLEPSLKIHLLHTISQLLQEQTDTGTFAHSRFAESFAEQSERLPAVTLQIGQWACTAPEAIAPRIWDATAAMAERMACWVRSGWHIHSEADLNHYTFSVAGAVGILLCDLWAWFAGEQLHRAYALHFGRGLQAVNILRNRKEDLSRGVDFFPDSWTNADMDQYARRHLQAAATYIQASSSAAFAAFVELPLLLANATLDALARGEEKVSRASVLEILRQLDARVENNNTAFSGKNKNK